VYKMQSSTGENLRPLRKEHNRGASADPTEKYIGAAPSEPPQEPPTHRQERHICLRTILFLA
jgi:hypothetical protein